MADQPNNPGSPDGIAADSLTSARLAVEAASDQVNEVGRHLKRAARSAAPAQSFAGFVRGFLEERTRATPLTMLGLAFVAGAIFVRRR